MHTLHNFSDNVVLEDKEFFDPVTPQSDWLTDADLDLLEVGLGLVKQADDLKAKRERESGLLADFKKSPTKDTFMPLYTSFKPLILSAARKNMHGSPLPQAAHVAYASQSFLDAIRTFDPKKGGSFRTHAFNTVQEKGKRLNLKYQNIGYIPEARATKYQAYQTALHVLREDLGREPSAIEIADELSLPVTEIEKLQKEVKKDLVSREHLVAKGMAFAQTDKAMQVAYDVHAVLEPKHQLVLEYTLGMYGKPSLVKSSGKSDISAIARQSGLGLNDVRSARKTIKREFQKHKSFMGSGGSMEGMFDESDED